MSETDEIDYSVLCLSCEALDICNPNERGWILQKDSHLAACGVRNK